MSNEKPPTVEEIDELAKIRKDSSRILAFTAIVLSFMVLALVTIGVIYGYSVYQRLDEANQKLTISDQKQVVEELGSCQFYNLIGELPVVTTGTAKTSAVGVKLIVDSRIAYITLGCPLPIAPPSPGLVLLAHGYGIKLPG